MHRESKYVEKDIPPRARKGLIVRILPIDNYSNKSQTNFKKANKFCKYSISTFIASTTLFMFSNSIDTFKSEKFNKENIGFVDTIASVLSVAGTALGIFGIEKEDKK